MDMRYWIPAGAVSRDEEKETDFQQMKHKEHKVRQI